MNGEWNNQLQVDGDASVLLLGGTPVASVFATIPLCFLVPQSEADASRLLDHAMESSAGYEGAMLDGFPAIDFDRLLKHLLS